jgi:hypothetical protein
MHMKQLILTFDSAHMVRTSRSCYGWSCIRASSQMTRNLMCAVGTFCRHQKIFSSTVEEWQDRSKFEVPHHSLTAAASVIGAEPRDLWLYIRLEASQRELKRKFNSARCRYGRVPTRTYSATSGLGHIIIKPAQHVTMHMNSCIACANERRHMHDAEVRI